MTLTITKEGAKALDEWFDGVVDTYVDGAPITRRAQFKYMTVKAMRSWVGYAWHAGWQAGREHLIATAPTPVPRTPYGWEVRGHLLFDKREAESFAWLASSIEGQSSPITEVYL